jgi:hypothetical protein
MDANRSLRILGFNRFGSAQERDAFMAWMREVRGDWSKSVGSQTAPKLKREPRGKLYPLEP